MINKIIHSGTTYKSAMKNIVLISTGIKFYFFSLTLETCANAHVLTHNFQYFFSYNQNYFTYGDGVKLYTLILFL